MIKVYLNKTSQKLLEDISRVESYINNNDWDTAYNDAAKLNTDWERTESIWTIFTNHHEIDSISVALKISLEFIREKDKAESLANISTLKHYISHIPEMERVVLKNIF
jgi:hypothetical protein